MRRTPQSRTTLAIVVALLVAGATFTAGAEPAVAAGTVRAMHFNICGAICNHGVVAKVGGGNDIVDDARNRIVNAKPAIVTLNEVCVGQFNRLKALLKGGGWTMDGAFRAQRSDGRCRGGSGFGDAVFTAGSIDGQKVMTLPNAGEHRAILCIRTAAGGGPVLACVLHTVTDNPLKSRQVAAAAVAANAAATQGPVIVGGDFNTTPSGMRALLDPARGGRFFDVDPQKAGTRGNKIDYILFSRAHFADPSGGPQPSQYSDHDVLVGQATRR